jgi:hypothetical protein
MIAVWFHSSQRYPSVLVTMYALLWGWRAIISLKSIPVLHNIDNATIRSVRSGVI